MDIGMTTKPKTGGTKPPNRNELRRRGDEIQKLALYLLEIGGDVRKCRINLDEAKTAIASVSRNLRKQVVVANATT